MNIYGYIRVSGAGQLDGDGFDRQREKVILFCQKHDLTLRGSYEEPAVSGTVEAMDRPTFAQMIRDIIASEGQVTAIVVERMDRLARDLMVSEFLLRECRSRNIKVFAADQEALIDLASNDVDPTRVLIRQVLGALSQWEKSMLVAKLRSARERVKAAKGKCEGKKPYGYYPAERKTLELLKSGMFHGWSVRKIASFLNESGLRTRKGTPWTGSSVAPFLK